MTRMSTALAAAMLTLSATGAGAATIISTGAGTAAPNSAGLGFQTGTAAQFTLARQTEITGIEIFANLVTGGRISFNISIARDNTAPNPIDVVYYREGQVAATGGAGAWVGLTNLVGIVLDPGTYWTQSGSDGILTGTQYGSAPDPLGNEALYLPTGGYREADALDLSWRISGVQLAAATPVPEPATWATMVAGFAVVAALRRCRLSLA